MRKSNSGMRAGCLKLFGGSSHPEMTKLIARKVGARVGDVLLGKFANRESHVELKECVRGQDIYVVQTAGGKTPNDHFMELLFLINALRLAAAANIVVITPFFFYSKGDQKDGYRVPITSKLVGAMLKKAGATHLMLLDPHAPQVEGFFDLIVDTLSVEPLFCEWIRHNIADWKNCIVISPDEGGAKRSVSLANDLVLDFAIISSKNKKLEQDSTHLCPHHIRKKKKSGGSDTESMKSGFVDASDVISQSSRSSCFDASEMTSQCGGNEREISEEPQFEAEEECPKMNGEHSEGDQGSSKPSYSQQRSTETQTDCLVENGFCRSISRHKEKSSRRSTKPLGQLSSCVAGRHAIIFDDMIDTGITVEIALEALKHGGASCVTILATHGVFSKNALRMLDSYGDFVNAVVVTNSISQNRVIEKGLLKNRFHVLDVSGLIAEFVRRHHYCESVSVLGRFMPIRDNLGGGRRITAERKAAQLVLEAAESAADQTCESKVNGSTAEEKQDEDPDGDDDDLEDSFDPDEINDESQVDLEQEEAERRKILEPREQQRLRKGFRMASICWD